MPRVAHFQRSIYHSQITSARLKSSRTSLTTKMAAVPVESSSNASHQFNSVFSSLPTTVFEKMSRAAAEYKSINLGQGFPDRELEGPDSMKEIVTQSMVDYPNQYPPLMGVPELRQAVAAHSSRYSGLTVDPATQVLITLGATEALACAFLGLLNPGDEVIVFAPLYDSYSPMIRRAGALPVIIDLHPPTWSIDKTQLEAAFTPKTKLIVVNTPHNPTGKVCLLGEDGNHLKHPILQLLTLSHTATHT